uniref:ATP synthase complex subunit 8 n=1 Tax=Heleophryne regis TaxID=143568 RepID=K9JZ93_HELRE|nr:ATP synthase F0 subunit 8 [Heleophryne regis]AEC33140.1 ATP synthase F0 subunit 8 [Heleophryne regis]
MPQLTPNPWFYIFLMAWAILLIMIPLKTYKHLTMNDPLTTHMKNNSSPWTWPWP